MILEYSKFYNNKSDVKEKLREWYRMFGEAFADAVTFGLRPEDQEGAGRAKTHTVDLHSVHSRQSQEQVQ